MAEDLKLTLQRIARKAEHLTERYNVVLREKEVAETRIKDLESTIGDQKKTIERLSQEIEYLKVVTPIVPNRNDVESSRAKLSELVREIDRCISELNDE